MIAVNSEASKASLARHRDAFTDATVGTLSMFCGGGPTLEAEEPLPGYFDGVVGVMSLVGDVSWSLMLCLPRETATALAEQFAGFAIDYDSDDMGDVVGELVNVLSGDVAARLETAGVRAELSLPTVARGSDFRLLFPEAASLLTARFASSIGGFWVVVGAAQAERQGS